MREGDSYFPEQDYYRHPDGAKKFIGKFIVDDEAIITADNWGDSLLSFFNREGGLTKELGAHFLENTDYPVRGYKQLLNCFLIKHPEQQKYAVAYVNYDRISILDENGVVVHSIVGPDFIQPELAFSRGTRINSVSDIRGYMFLDANHQYIFAQYFGTQYYERDGKGSLNRNYSHTIHVFGWDGEAVARITLDRGIETFIVDGENLIAFDPASEDPFVKYDISGLH